MKTNIEFEIKEEIIQWKITIDMDIQWFLNIASRVYQTYVGRPLGQKRIEK